MTFGDESTFLQLDTDAGKQPKRSGTIVKTQSKHSQHRRGFPPRGPRKKIESYTCVSKLVLGQNTKNIAVYSVESSQVMFHLIRHHSPWGGHVFLLWMSSLCCGCVCLMGEFAATRCHIEFLNVICPLIVAFVFLNLRVLLKLDILWPLRATLGEISHQ